MAKSRKIRPEFFRDDRITDMPPVARILLLGLATLADKSDRLKYDPAAIKAAILPFDDVDCAGLLGILVRNGQIVLTEEAGQMGIYLHNVGAWCEKIIPTHGADQANLRARRRRALPGWANRDAIRAIYAEAKRRNLAGEDVHVDHMVPLVSNKVCGLHVHQNLAIIPARDNLQKSNKFDTEE